MSTFQDFKYKFSTFNAFEKIIAINGIIFIIGALIGVFGRTNDPLYFLTRVAISSRITLNIWFPSRVFRSRIGSKSVIAADPTSSRSPVTADIDSGRERPEPEDRVRGVGGARDPHRPRDRR